MNFNTLTDLIISERKNIIKLNYVNKRILILGLLFCLPDVYLNASGNNASNLKDESRQTEQGIQNVEDFPISDEIFSTWLEWLVSNVEIRNSFLADYLQWESVEDYSECQSDYLKLEQYIRMCIKLTAWHEAGHAIFHLDRYQRGRSEICLATIIPKGKVTGEVRSLRFKAPKNIASIKHDVLFCLAGRSGERLFFEKMKKKNKHCLYRIENYEGCESDLAQAMIFAEELRELTDEYQSEKRLEREDECNIFMAKLVLETDTFLNENSDAHEAIAKALLQHGILAGKQINDIAEKVIQSRTSDYKSPLEKLQSRL